MAQWQRHRFKEPDGAGSNPAGRTNARPVGLAVRTPGFQPGNRRFESGTGYDRHSFRPYSSMDRAPAYEAGSVAGSNPAGATFHQPDCAPGLRQRQPAAKLTPGCSGSTARPGGAKRVVRRSHSRSLTGARRLVRSHSWACDETMCMLRKVGTLPQPKPREAVDCGFAVHQCLPCGSGDGQKVTFRSDRGGRPDGRLGRASCQRSAVPASAPGRR